jgi:hypothetical protein
MRAQYAGADACAYTCHERTHAHSAQLSRIQLPCVAVGLLAIGGECGAGHVRDDGAMVSGSLRAHVQVQSQVKPGADINLLLGDEIACRRCRH